MGLFPASTLFFFVKGFLCIEYFLLFIFFFNVQKTHNSTISRVLYFLLNRMTRLVTSFFFVFLLYRIKILKYSNF